MLTGVRATEVEPQPLEVIWQYWVHTWQFLGSKDLVKQVKNLFDQWPLSLTITLSQV